MTGLTKKQTEREAILQALKTPPPGGHFVWNGKDEEDRPLTREEMQAAITETRKRGRPAGSSKESTTIRFDRDVLNAFRNAGPGWQSRMNAALRDWLRQHSPN